MENVFYIIMAGVLIGVLVSAPMGPTGVLVIQRTLNKGRNQGFATGLGASLSDLCYSMLTGFGLSFVNDFITGQRLLLQLLGSIVLVIYGIYLFRNNPSRRIVPPGVSSSTITRDFITGFLLTLSNPLIVFFIIGLFARFNFLDFSTTTFHYICGYVSIVIGAVGWWLFVTYVVNKLRHRFTIVTMRRINRVIAIIILVMATIGLLQSLSRLLNIM